MGEQLIKILFGIMVAAFIFAGFLWSATRIFRTRGAARAAHATVALAVLAGAASLSFLWITAAPIIGAVLLAAGLIASALERGWARVLPLFPALFGLALLLGLSFAGA